MNMKVLVIEDDKVLSKNIQGALEMEDYTVDVAIDGHLGETKLLENNYDCIILDVNLPGKSGFEIAREFRKRNTMSPILLLTAYDQLEDKIEGYNSGADDYLTKPFYMKELALRIHSLIKRTKITEESNQAPALADIIVKDIVIDQKNKQITKCGKKISLTPREYQILLKLALAGGEVVSKKELIKEIWGSVFDHNTNTVEVYVNFLRNKIDKPFKDQMIKTRIGYGYYLNLET